MSWQDRVNGSIHLTSPSGAQFNALWRGDKRDKAKKAGIFEYPKARGAEVQDLDMGPVKYPLTIYFEGRDNDIIAQRFWNACNERGAWRVFHPTKGNLKLQLISVAEEVQPVTDGNCTRFDTDWLEIGINNPSVSAAQLESDVLDQIDNLQSAAATQFESKVKVGTPSLLSQLKSAVARVLVVVESIKSAVAGVMAKISAIRQAVLGVVNSTVMSIASLAGVIQSFITLPGLVIQDIRARFQYFEQILGGAVNIAPKAITAGGINAIAVQELVLTSCLCGMAQSVVEANLTTREEAVGYLDSMQATFLAVIKSLDATQTLYENSAIDQQYFSQSESFNDLSELMRQVRELLLRRSFDLAAAKRITLRKDRAPIEIALTEHVDFDAFIAANALKGGDILLLPAGRQVVIYS